MKLYYIDKTQKNLRRRIAQKVISYLRIIKKSFIFDEISYRMLYCNLIDDCFIQKKMIVFANTSRIH